MPPEFDVVVVTTDSGSKYAVRCLRSIRMNSHGSVRVRVIENSEQEGRVLLSSGYTTLCPGENLGWTRAANVGLSMATAPHVVLMNDDTEVKTGGWLEKMREHFTEGVGTVYPAGARASHWCLMISQECLKDVGLYDLRFADGYGAMDNDWNLRAETAGWPNEWGMVEATDVEVHHVGGATFGDRREAERKINLELFRQKWPDEEIW